MVNVDVHQAPELLNVLCVRIGGLASCHCVVCSNERSVHHFQLDSCLSKVRWSNLRIPTRLCPSSRMALGRNCLPRVLSHSGAIAVVPSAHATIVLVDKNHRQKWLQRERLHARDLYIQCRSFRHLHTRRSRRWSNKIHRLGLPLHRSCRHRGRCIQCIQSRTTRHLLMQRGM